MKTWINRKRIAPEMKTFKRTTVILQRDDFNASALDLQIWDSLSGDDPNVTDVEVEVIKRHP